MSSAKDLTSGQTSSLLTMPREILVIIFGQLKETDLLRVSKTCHHLKDVARDPELWKKVTLTYEKIQNKNEACRNHVSRCKILRKIFITGEEKEIRSDKIMAVVMKAKDTLTTINISPCFAGLSKSSIEKISDMSQLTHLAVGGDKLGPEVIAALARLTELRSLKVHGIKCRNFVGGNMAALVDLFSTLKKLEEVEIKMNRNYPSDLVVKSLVDNNPNLHHLDISSKFHPLLPNTTNELSSSSLILLADKCPQLTYIGIGNLTLFSSTSIIKLVSSCPKLKYANFEGTIVDDTTLAIMSNKCPDLEYIKISNCRMITQEGLETFVYPAYAANLKCLDISDDFTSQMISSPNFLKRLRHDLPNLKIKSEVDVYDHDDSSYDSDSDEDYATVMGYASLLFRWHCCLM